MRYYFGQLFSDFHTKMILSSIGAIISVIENFYGEMVWGFLMLFVLDFITGIMKSKYKGVPISSKRLRSSVSKLGAYMILLTAVIVTSKYEASFVPIIALIYYWYMFTELKSIFENVGEMGIKLPNFLKVKVDQKLDEIDQKVDAVKEITETLEKDNHEK
ncbi:holin [Bacillus phage vB_BsuM-Goe10]|nr:holin [Bacillus phage vB_BsuM-Goe10]